MNSHWSDYERYLKPLHLKGQAMTLTIVKATEEETHPQKGKTVVSPVLWFRELPFGFILSPTNRHTLSELYGDDITSSIGKPIAVAVVNLKVAGNDKQPIRILKQRPAAPKIEVSTGEIVPPALEEPADGAPDAAQNEAPSELDQFFGPRQEPQTPTPNSNSNDWPSTEYEFIAWLKANSITGQETRSALGTDAKSWLKSNPGKSYLDVAQVIAATLGRGVVVRSFPLNHTTQQEDHYA